MLTLLNHRFAVLAYKEAGSSGGSGASAIPVGGRSNSNGPSLRNKGGPTRAGSNRPAFTTMGRGRR